MKETKNENNNKRINEKNNDNLTGLTEECKPRFIETTVDGYVLMKDTLTGNIWFFGFRRHGVPKGTYSEALNAIESYNKNNTAGYNDWRLPFIDEAKQIILETPVERIGDNRRTNLYSDKSFYYYINKIWIDRRSCDDDINTYVADFASGSIVKESLYTGKAFHITSPCRFQY